jgi:hypothetical protein
MKYKLLKKSENLSTVPEFAWRGKKNRVNLNGGIYDQSKFQTDIFRIKTSSLPLGTPV